MPDKHQLIDLVLQINSSAANGLAITEIWMNSVFTDELCPLILNKLQCIKCIERNNHGIMYL